MKIHALARVRQIGPCSMVAVGRDEDPRSISAAVALEVAVLTKKKTTCG